MRARPDWRAAVLVTAIALVVALVVLVVGGGGAPGGAAPGFSLAAQDRGDSDNTDDSGGSGGDAEPGDDEKDQESQQDQKKQEGQKKQEKQQDQAQDGDEFPGRDGIGRASADEYLAIDDVRSNSGAGEGGDFSGGSYSIECALSEHRNSDNPIIAPGVRNGAQHTHDYAGNESTNFASDSETLEEATTTCTNGDRSPLFWPVLRDLRGVGPDVGADGGSLDGNVGSFVNPVAVDYTFHGHGTRTTQPMPLNMVLVTGSAKASTTEDDPNANAKYSCSGATDRVTDQYPVCPDGQDLQRVFDFPSCWNGEDLDSEDHASHIVYPDENGECADDMIPVPALRITVSYDAPPGRNFAIDSFPEQQHDPITDHALVEYLATERRAEQGADCINAGRQCRQGRAENVVHPTDDRDRVPGSVTYLNAFATHMHRSHPHGTPAPTRPDPPRSRRRRATPRSTSPR